MNSLNRKEFADLCEVSKAAITKAIKQERICVQDNKIDPTHPTNAYYLEKAKNRADYQRPKKRGPGRRPTTGKRKTNAEIGAAVTAEIEKRANNLENVDGVQIPLNLDGLSKTSTDRLKTIEQIRSLQLKNDQERRELISRDIIKQFIFRLYLVDTNELKTFGDRVAPAAASIFGVDDEAKILELNQFVESEIYKTLNHIKRLMDDFLRFVGAPSLAKLKKEIGETYE